MALIVIVEDHADTRVMYAEFLREEFEVLEAESGDEALALMDARTPDLVITDLSLPGMDGFELIARMRSQPALAEVPVICLSGYGGYSHERRARTAGCSRLLEKPCLPDMLSAAASEILRERNPHGQAT